MFMQIMRTAYLEQWIPNVALRVVPLLNVSGRVLRTEWWIQRHHCKKGCMLMFIKTTGLQNGEILSSWNRLYDFTLN